MMMMIYERRALLVKLKAVVLDVVDLRIERRGLNAED
jgi:hypothetical protein